MGKHRHFIKSVGCSEKLMCALVPAAIAAPLLGHKISCDLLICQYASLAGAVLTGVS